MISEKQVKIIRFTVGPLLSIVSTYYFFTLNIMIDSLEFVPIATGVLFGSWLFFVGFPIPEKWIKYDK